MFIGHLPAGYLLTRYLIKRNPLASNSQVLLIVGLIASVLPDLDLLYFYLIDNRQNLHHGYWPHLPIVWLGLTAISFAAARRPGSARRHLPLLRVLYLNIFLHLVLDTLVGHIHWLYPFSSQSVVFFDVPARHGWWVWNFVLHWTFALELALCLWAAVLLWRDDRQRAAGAIARRP